MERFKFVRPTPRPAQDMNIRQTGPPGDLANMRLELLAVRVLVEFDDVGPWADGVLV